MKRFSFVLVSMLVLSSLLLSACQPAKTKVRVATNAEFAPFEYVDEKTKEITGFDIELIKAVATKANMEIEIVNTGFDAMLAGLSQCQYDAAIAAITVTDDRKAAMLFSDPYINAGQIVVVKKDSAIKSKDDLVGKVVGAQIGTTGAEEAGKIANVQLKPYDTYEFAMLDLINGQIEAVIVDYPTALGFVAKNADKIMVVGQVFTDESYAIAVCNKKSDLQTKLNEAIKALKADGTIDKLQQKWLAGN